MSKKQEERNEGVSNLGRMSMLPPCFEIKHLVYFHLYYLEYTISFLRTHTFFTLTYFCVCVEGCIQYICILYIQVCKGVFALNLYPGVGCILVCQDVSTIFNVYPGILGCIRYVCLSRCVRVYPLLLIHSGISPWTCLLELLLYLEHLLREYPYRSVIVGYLSPDIKVLE